MVIAIEPLDPKHSADVQELGSHPEVARTCDIPSPMPPNGASGWINRMEGYRREGKGFTYAVLRDSDLVGCCGLWKIDSAARTGDLGFWIGYPYWGHGYATEASRLLLGLGFVDFGLKRIYANCLKWNARACRVLEKLEFRFTHEGSPPKGSKFPPAERFFYFELIKAQWESDTPPLLVFG